MKMSQLAILFVAVFLVVVILTDIKTDNLAAMAETQKKMDKYMDQAIENAAESLMQIDSDTGLEKMDKEAAIESFFSSMYASLGILSDPIAQEKFRAYVPVIAVTCEDGYYLMYNDEFIGTDGYSYITRRWTEKIPYAYEDINFVYCFTLSGRMKLYDKNGVIFNSEESKLFETSLEDIQTADIYSTFRSAVGSECFLLNDEAFAMVKQQSVISMLEEDLSWYTSRHNEIAKHYGISYQFSLPATDKSDWIKTLEGAGIIIVFQGLPLIEDATRVYNRMSFSGAGVRKGKVYYIEQSGWYNLYHKEGCSLLINNLNVQTEKYSSVEQVAALGAYACRQCDPGGVHPPE